MSPQRLKMPLVNFQIMMPLVGDAAIVVVEKLFQFVTWPYRPPRVTCADAPTVGRIARPRLAAHSIDYHLDFPAKPGTHLRVLPVRDKYPISPRVKRYGG